LEILPGDFRTDYPSTIEFTRVPGLKSQDFPIMESFMLVKMEIPKNMLCPAILMM
jgi:23S rRNA A1618 N6-methylase RlmF